MERLDCSRDLLDYTVVRTGYIQEKQVMMVLSLDLLEHIVDLKVNVLAKVHALEKVHMLTSQVSQAILVEDSKQVNILAIRHLHHYLMVKIQVHQASCHFPFLVTMELLRRQV